MNPWGIKIWCGFLGVGKSWLAEYRGWNDSDSSHFSKTNDWPECYIDHIMGLEGPVMCSTHKEVRDCLFNNGIPFGLVYPRRDCKEEYLKRYWGRGNDANFIQLIDENWDNWLTELETDYASSVIFELEPGVYLSDLQWIMCDEEIPDEAA